MLSKCLFDKQGGRNPLWNKRVDSHELFMVPQVYTVAFDRRTVKQKE